MLRSSQFVPEDVTKGLQKSCEWPVLSLTLPASPGITDVIKILQQNSSEAEFFLKKSSTLVPDILFRMPIKDNVTCKTCKLLLALHLPPLLCPSSEFALSLQWTETQEKRAPGQECHRQTLSSKSTFKEKSKRAAENPTALLPMPFITLVVPRKLLYSLIEFGSSCEYLSEYSNIHVKYGIGMRKGWGRWSWEKHTEHCRTEPVCQTQL